MKNILVTGGYGFIGVNFIRYVFENTDFDGRIVNLDKLTYAANPLSLVDMEKRVGERYVFVKGDIKDEKLVDSVFKEYEIDTVVHFAAESHVDRSIVNPGEFVQTNVFGTYVLLNTARKFWRNGDNFIFHHISTDEVFGSLGEDGYFSEETKYSPRSPYSASKASADHLVMAYYHTYDLPITMSNCSNNYGPYQFPEKLIPLMILNILEGKSLPVYGKGLNIRDWLFVKDHISAIWMILENKKMGESYAIGGENEWKNIDLVRKICEIMDEKIPPEKLKSYKELIGFVKDRPGHDYRYAMDCSKIKKELGWKPSVTFEEGLEKTIDWYLYNKDWVKKVKTEEYRKWIKNNYNERR
jgi:dTDP-glucose 4,6-dehydratase